MENPERGHLRTFVEKIINLTRFFKINHQVITLHDEQKGLYPTVEGNFPDYDEASKEEKVLIAGVEGRMRKQQYRNSILYHAFASRGFKPLFVLCDGELDLCHGKCRYRGEAACSVCKTRGKNITEKFGIAPEYFSDYLPDNYVIPDVSIKARKYRAIPIKEYVNSSFRKYHKRYSIDLSDDNQRQSYMRLYKSAIICIDTAEQIINEHKIRALITAHPAYIYGGLFMEVATKHQIPSYSHSPVRGERKIKFGQGSNKLTLQTYRDSDLLNQRLEMPLSETQKEWVESYCKQLETGGSRVYDYAKFGKRGIERNNNIVLGLFPNLAWDAKLDSRNLLFDDPFDWIAATADTCENSPDIQLIIKSHPAEEILGTNESIYDWAMESLDTSENSSTTVLPPDTDVDQYKLIDIIDASVVNDSTVGLESVYRKKPSIVVGNAHYRNYGFSVDPESIKEYESYLMNARDLTVTEDMLNRCKRYMYYSYNQCNVPFRYIDYSKPSNSFTKVSYEQIAEDDNLDFIVSKISNGESVTRFQFD